MKRVLCLTALMTVTLSLMAAAVEPAYAGRYGNAEEPALRPYKWLFRGIKALGYQTGKSLEHGNMKTPVLGTLEGFTGLRRGTYELGESVYRGSVFAPAPMTGSYKDLGRLNSIVDEDVFLRNVSDFLFSWEYFPVQKLVEHYPLESEEEVELRLENAQEARQARKLEKEAEKKAPAPQKIEVPEGNVTLSVGNSAVYRVVSTANGAKVNGIDKQSDVKQAQKRYLGKKADMKSAQLKNGRGNLLKLAK